MSQVEGKIEREDEETKMIDINKGEEKLVGGAETETTDHYHSQQLIGTGEDKGKKEEPILKNHHIAHGN